MAEAHTTSLQETFLTHLREQKVAVTMFLVNGVRLQGYIDHYDRFGVLLTRDGQAQFVYKHAISAINPVSAVQMVSSDQQSD